MESSFILNFNKITLFDGSPFSFRYGALLKCFVHTLGKSCAFIDTMIQIASFSENERLRKS